MCEQSNPTTSEYITFLLFNYFEHLYSECYNICTLTTDNSVYYVPVI